MCQEKTDFLGCSEAYKSCLAGSDLQEIVDDEDGYFANIGGQVTELVAEFDVNTSCNSDGTVTLGSPRQGEFGVDTGLTSSSSKDEVIAKLQAFK